LNSTKGRQLKTLITPLLIQYLQANGYRYCLAKKQAATAGSPNKCLVLLPLRQKPEAGSLPDRYYTLLKTAEEPAVLAEAPEGDTLVVVELSTIDLGGYLNFLFNAQAKSA
jgi:hypothetical protein